MSNVKITKKSKIYRVLSAFANGNSYNRFEAERLLHDHALYATVYDIEKRYGVQVSRKNEEIKGYMGCKVRCTRYWLSNNQKLKAKKIISIDGGISK